MSRSRDSKEKGQTLRRQPHFALASYERAKGYEGQAVLLVILVMAVVGSVTLSVASRSVSGLRVQEVANESVKAFKAAEAGLERALLGGQDVSGTTGGVNFSSTFGEGGSTGLVTDEKVAMGEVVQVDTTGATGDLKVMWSSSAAIKVTEYYGTGGLKSYYYDSTGSRSPANQFSVVGWSMNNFQGVSFDRAQSIPLTTGTTKMVRVMVLYADSQIGFQPLGAGVVLPDQKKVVESKGELGSGDKKVTREIQYTETEDRLPVVFDHTLYTNGSLTQ
jgi:type II secretory pathway pseudopilin PulG